MAVQFLRVPTGDQYFPTVSPRESGLPQLLSEIAKNVQQNRMRRRVQENEAALLEKMDLDVPGITGVKKPDTFLGGLGNIVQDIFGTGPTPRSDLATALAKAGIENKYVEKKYGPEALAFERAKYGLKAQANKLTVATGLRKEFNAAKVYKDYQEINRASIGMEKAYSMSLKASSKIAGDQALVILFNKMLDPGSVVRESEFARTPEGASLIRRLQGKWKQVGEGGVGLTDADRTELVNMARELLNGAKATMNKHIERYQSLAKDYNIPWKLIGGGMDRFNLKTDQDTRSYRLGGDTFDFASEDEKTRLKFLKMYPKAQEVK